MKLTDVTGDLDGSGTLMLTRNDACIRLVGGGKGGSLRNFNFHPFAYGGWRAKARATIAALRFIWIGVTPLKRPPSFLAFDADDETTGAQHSMSATPTASGL